MKPSESFELNREAIRQAAQKYNLHNPRVFGSVADGTDTEDSDIDILVFSPLGNSILELAGFLAALEDKIPFKIDIHTEKSLPIAFRQEVLDSAKPV
ncbi:MAG: nucleotidyltransferase domain-containing protein [Candidatus Pacebacteria bacterium]|nr:nucleotidyltransferase domain-containing protein [Candidatus Paceibacterota bacterium]